jgi:hypothetical protein
MLLGFKLGIIGISGNLSGKCARSWLVHGMVFGFTTLLGIDVTHKQWNPVFHWIGLRENLNRKPWFLHVFTIKYRVFRLKLSHHPILWIFPPLRSLHFNHFTSVSVRLCVWFQSRCWKEYQPRTHPISYAWGQTWNNNITNIAGTIW